MIDLKRTPLTIILFLLILLGSLLVFELKAAEIRGKNKHIQIPVSVISHDVNQYRDSDILPVSEKSTASEWFNKNKDQEISILRIEWNKFKTGLSEDEYATIELRILMLEGRNLEGINFLMNISNSRNLTYKENLFAGILYKRLDRNADAIFHFEKAIELSSNSFAAYFNLGLLYLNLNQYNLAETHLLKAVTLSGGINKARSYRLLGRTYLGKNNREKGINALNEAILLEPSSFESRLLLADFYADAPEKALSYIKEASKLAPASSRVWIRLSEFEIQQNSIQKGLAILQDAESLVPDFWIIAAEQAKLHIEIGEYKQAEQICKQRLAQAPESYELHFQLARAYYAQGDYQKAEAGFLKVIKKDSVFQLESMNNLGILYLTTRSYEKAVDTFQKALELNPLYSKAHYNLGLAYLEQEYFKEAKAQFQKSIEDNPEMSAAWYNLGVSHGHLGESLEAIEAYSKALSLDPADQKARLNLAVQYKKTGNNIRAREQYTLLLNTNPNYPEAWYNLGILHKDAGNLLEAESAYRKAIELDSENNNYYLNLSALLSSQDKTDEAVSALLEAIDIHPEIPQLRFNLAIQHRKLENYSKAIESLEQAVQLNSEYSKAWRLAGITYSDLDEHAKAVEAFTMAEKLDGDVYIHYLLAGEYYSLGEYSEAEIHFSKALSEIKDNAYIWYNAARNLQKLNKEAEAQNYYNKALHFNPKLADAVTSKLEFIEASERIYIDLIQEFPYAENWRLQLASLYIQKEQIDAAEKVLITARNEIKGSLKVELKLAELYNIEKQYAKEISVYESINENSISDPAIYKRVAESCLKLDDTDKAIQFIEQGLYLYPEEWSLWELKSSILYQQGAYDEVLTILNDNTSIVEQNAELIILKGKAYYKNKDFNTASDYFLKSIQTNPDYIWTYIWYGRSLRKRTLYEQAEKSFLEALNLDNNHRITLTSLGDLYREWGKNEAALEVYNRALEQDPTNTSLRNRINSLE